MMPIFAAAALVAVVAASPLPTPQALAIIAVAAPRATLALQVAKTEDQRERGLMSVTKLAPHAGMLFVFPQDDAVDFWMKDTLVPLDMVFVGSNGVVRKVYANVPAVPLDTPDENIPRREGNARYVIELPAGDAAADGIVEGVHLAVESETTDR